METKEKLANLLKKIAVINAHRFKIPFRKDDYDDAFKFFIEVVTASIKN